MQEEHDLFVRRITHALSITVVEAEASAKKFFTLPSNEQAAYLDDLDALEASQQREEAFDDFNKFAHAMWPGFIDGRHHKVMAKKFEEIATGKIKRLIINMPPRHTKSEFASYMLPAWFLGRDPSRRSSSVPIRQNCRRFRT